MNFASFNWLDYVIIGVIVLSSLISLIRGFVREAISLASWIIAFWVALTFSSNLSLMLQTYIQNATVRISLAFFILFAATLLIGAIINYIVTQVVDKTGLSGTDRMLGVVFGFGRGILLVALLLLLGRVTLLPQSPVWQNARLVASFEPLEVWLQGFLPEAINENIKFPEQTAALKKTELKQNSPQQAPQKEQGNTTSGVNRNINDDR